MTYRIACQCGKGVFAELPDAGGRLVCGCGRAVVVPVLSKLQRMPPAARRDNTPPRPVFTEAKRTLSSAMWWFGAGLVLVVLGGWLAEAVEKSPGAFVVVIGLAVILVGGVRLIRGLVQRNSEAEELGQR